jgi:hypothetical protein
METSSIRSLALAFLATIVLGGCAAPQRSLDEHPIPPTRVKLPEEPFTHAPEKPHDASALYFTFDQLEHYYRVPGEYTTA